MNRRAFLRYSAGASAGVALAAALPLIGPFASETSPRFRADSAGQGTNAPGLEAFSGKERFNELLIKARKEGWEKLPMGELMATIGMELRGVPYVGATLELDDRREVCSVNLLGLDCVTFFESALGFARMLKSGGSTPDEMLRQVLFTRYREGKLTDYTSRLHYTTDWFHDNERKGTVRMITADLPGAERFTRIVNFMSTHPDSYRQLKANPELVPVIAKIEAEINARKMHFVPKEKTAVAEADLRAGDIIGITTTIKGIDCSHTGMCYRDEQGVLRLLHASLTKKEVTLDDRLSAYLASVTKHTGIMAARPLELRS